MLKIKKLSVQEAINNELLSSLRKEKANLLINDTGDLNNSKGEITYSDFREFSNITSENASLNYINFNALAHIDSKVEAPQISKINPDQLFNSTINLEYNFLIKTFEDYITNNFNTLSELNLPNFYDTINQELIKTPETRFDSIDFFEKNLSTKYPSLPIKEEYRTIIYDSDVDEELIKLINKNNLSNNNLGTSIYAYFNVFNKFKEQFPFYTEIFFNNSKEDDNSTKNFTNIFNEFKIYGSFLEYFSKNSSNSNILLNKKIFDTVQPVDVSFINKNVKKLNFSLFYNQTIINEAISGDVNELIAKMQELVSLKKPSMNNIINNEICHSEVVGYKITKYDTINGSTPLQEFYLPGLNSSDRIEFIDTQVKYNKNYRYKLSLLVAVVGANVNFSSNANQKQILQYTLNPVVNVYEIESSEYQNVLLDNPPLEPEVEIIPFIGIHNKIKINLNTSVGRKTQKPFVFSDEEEEIIEKISKSQDRLDDKIIYESEEPSDFFEMYKLERQPKSLQDFLNYGEKITIDNLESSAGSFDDAIKPNKKYYYIFRSFDYHKKFSNPSPIYEVEIVNDNGMIFPLINIFEINKDLLKDPTKKFKKYLSVSPSLGNTLISLEKNNEFKGLNNKKTVLEKVLVGVNNPDIWGKKFKIRINSISSGRKIDINLVFDLKKLEK